MYNIYLINQLKEKFSELEFDNSEDLSNLRLEARQLFKKLLPPNDVEEYISSINDAPFYLFSYSSYTTETAEREQWEKGKKQVIGTIDVIIKMLALESSMPTTSSISTSEIASDITNKKIFIVHGHDEAMKLIVKDTLISLGLEPIILHEQLDNGDTVIEKFEREAKDVNFAVILLSPDDVGKSIKEDAYRPRARQNVILELGYFTGKLGRRKTFNLLKNPSVNESIEQPNDLSGVIYHELDTAGGWKIKLCQSLKSAGYQLNIENLIG